MTSINLAEHISKLRAKEITTPRLTADHALLFWGCAADKSYLAYLKQSMGGITTYINLTTVTTITQVKMACSSKGIDRIISSSPTLLHKLLHWDRRAAAKLSNYAGSYFTIPREEGLPDIEIVFIAPLKQLATVTYSQFLAKRYVTKLTKPNSWYKTTEFSWELLTAANQEDLFYSFSNAFLIAIDIETFKDNATVRCLSYTAFFISPNNAIESKSVVLPLDSVYSLATMRRWNWELKAPKVFQNGKYDIAYLARYSAPVYNYLYDTAHMFHSWLSELPKDLAFLNAFFIQKAMYWKDLANTTDLHEYYRYNALDSWATGNALLSMVLELPAWAVNNYVAEFPLIFPCHLAEMTGIERDMDSLIESRAKEEVIIKDKGKVLDTILGVSGFNVKSSPQMLKLLKILGCGDLTSADEKNLKKARFRHPFNARVIKLVLDIRAARTLKEKYLQVGAKAKEFHRLDGTGNRILYALNPHGTDSSRLASKEHHFWCGLQIQNIPRGFTVKATFKADPGFYISEVDLEQAESRDTAYISGDENLIQAVDHSPDFHSANAAAFFGVPFEEIFDATTSTVLNKALRQLAKPVNHGANYNMGAYILVETMGEENLMKARTLLGLPSSWDSKEVATSLLGTFHKTYPDIKKVFYTGVVQEVELTGLLTHKLMTLDSQGRWELNPMRLTRRCFGSPANNKQHLNALIAHPPQSLNAQTLNKAWMKVFYAIAIHPKHRDNFKLCAQIHDSILFQYRIGHEYLIGKVKECMEIPVTIKAYDEKIRTFTVPAEAKSGKGGTPATYWSDLE